ncbi:MAG: MFS transporter [Deltaproteobacteria bacterium]|nr:MFS transporter [Deltaproteobacteria bacterium]
MEQIKTSVTPYRWVVLVVFMFIIAMSQIMWMTFAPIARDAAAVYTAGNIGYIDLLAILAMLAWLPFCIPAAWCIDNFGLKRGAGIGVILIGLCGFMRIFAPNYGWLLVCMIGCAIAQPFVLNAFTKLASNWFPEDEEALASGLLTMSMFIGFTTVMFATDFILAHYRKVGTVEQGIDVILYVYGIPALISMILFFIFVKDKPEEPPNPIAAEKKVSMTVGLKSLFRNKDFLYLLGLFFIGVGSFNAILTKIDYIFKNRPLDIDSTLAPGIVGGLIVIGGIFGAVILSAFSDKYHKRKIFLILAAGMAIPLTLLLQHLSSIVLLGICGFVFGFFLISAMPVGLTYAVERTHPVPEATSNGILMLSGQISGLPIVFFFNMTAITVLFGAALLLALLMQDVKPGSTT